MSVSTEEQAQNLEGSIKNQQERLKAHVDFKNSQGTFGEIVEIFIDRARSGKDTNRPELQRYRFTIKCLTYCHGSVTISCEVS